MKRRPRCPHCGKPIEWSAAWPDRPFCSERCRLLDLGAWASEAYRIPGEAADSGEVAPRTGEQDVSETNGG